MGSSLLSRLYTSQHWPSSMKTAPAATAGGGSSSDDSPSHFLRALTDALLALFRGDWGSTPGGYCHAPVAWSQPVAPSGMRPRGFGCFFSASSAATRWARRSRSASLDASAASSSRTRCCRAAASGSAGGGGSATARRRGDRRRAGPRPGGGRRWDGPAAAVGPRPRRPARRPRIALDLLLLWEAGSLSSRRVPGLANLCR